MKSQAEIEAEVARILRNARDREQRLRELLYGETPAPAGPTPPALNPAAGTGNTLWDHLCEDHEVES